jgi:WD40 repeat protein
VFSPDGDWIASYSPWENAVRLWDVEHVGYHNFLGEDRVLRLPDGYEAIAVDFHGQGLRVLLTRRLSRDESLMQALDSGITYDRTVYVWEAWVAPNTTRASMADLGDVRDAEYDARGERIVAGGTEGVAILSAQTGALVRRLPAPEDIVSDVAFSADGGRIVAAFRGGAVRIWDAASGTERAVLNGHRGAAYSAAFSHDGGRVVTTGDDGMVRVWNAQTGRGIAELRLQQEAVSASFDDTGSRVLIQHNSAVRIWTPGSDASPIDLAIPEGQIMRAEWDRGREMVLVALSTGSALFDARSGALLGMITARTPVEDAGRAVFDTTGVMLAVTEYTSSVRILDVATSVELDVLRGDADATIFGAAFSPNGERLISWSDAGLQVWTLDPALTAPRANVMEYVCASALADGWSLLSEEELREAPMLSASDQDACALDRVM